MTKRRKKWPWIVLIVVFSVVMILDIIAWSMSSKVPSGFGGDFKNFDTSNMPSDFDPSNMPSFGNGERPDMSGDFDPSNMPSFGNGERPDMSRDFSPSNMPGRGNKKLILPILIVCILGDVFSIIMLVRAVKSGKSDSDSEDGNGDADNLTPEEKREASKKAKTAAKIMVLIALVTMTTVLAVLTKKKETETANGSVAAEETVLEASLEEASISSVITAGGQVSVEPYEIDYYPDGIEISKYHVSAGDTVSEGDVIADVDKVSVMNTIKTVQDNINDLDEELQDVADDASSSLEATAAGRVKKIFAEEGTAVKDTVSEYGALMLISLDGTMAVDIATSEELNIGEKVDVQVGDDTVSGRVSALKDDYVTVTIDDQYGEYGETVTVSCDDKTIGNGQLYIHYALCVTGYEGIVDDILVSENDEISKGKDIIKLTEGVYSAKYEKLLKQRSILEDQMKSLFELYQSGVVTAKLSGDVTAVNDSLENVISTGKYNIESMSNSPTGEDDSGYINYAILITGMDEEGLQVKMSASPLGNIDLTTVGQIGSAQCSDAGVIGWGSVSRVYGYDGTQWVQQSAGNLQVGEVVVASFDGAGNCVWIVRQTAPVNPAPEEGGENPDPNNENPGETPEGTPEGTPGETPSEQPEEGQQNRENTDPWKKPENGSLPENAVNPENGQMPEGTENPSGENVQNGSVPENASNAGASGFSGMPSGFSGSYAAAPSAAAQEEEKTGYEIEEVGIVSITPKNTVDIEVTIDELDITGLYIGQTCKVTFDAISGKEFDGKVTAISTSGVNEGGNTKYTAKVTLDREEDMLSGMNTHVTFTREEKQGVLLIPENALYEDETGVYVYTMYDPEKDILSGRRDVETGLADGDNVEILSGLEQGETVYYRFADSLSVTF